MIELKNVTKKFENSVALENIDLTIKKGITFGLLGSNGAGKSTIFRLIQGIYKQDSGEVLVENQKVYDGVLAKEKVFFVSDETSQFGSFTLMGLKNYYQSFYPNFSEETFEKLQNVVKLPLDKKLNQFSKGMKRQAIVIVALACQTEYLLLDEAFDGLDPTMRNVVKRMIVDAMMDRELTTIISSHNLNEINDMCDQIALLHKGKVILQKEVDSVKGSVHKVQIAFTEEVTQASFENIPIIHYEKTGRVVQLICHGNIDTIQQQIQGMNPVLFEQIPLSLEEVFIYEMEAQGYEFSSIQ